MLKKIAVKKGFIPKSTADKLSDQEALQLVCLLGFSTKNVTSLMGEEGLGLNTIKQRVEDLGGYLRIESEKGKGYKGYFVGASNKSYSICYNSASC
jgi:two-component system chemotaxis sensor kinase CheA